MFLNIVFAIIGAVLVLIGADKLTDGAVGLARRFNIPELVIGLTIVAFGTSLPEFIVSLMASINHAPAMSVGNIVGSNIFNTLMIVGCSALLYPIVVSKGTIAKDIPLSVLASVVLPALAMDSLISAADGTDILSRGDGIALLGFFAIFMAYSFSIAKSGAQDGTADDAAVPAMSTVRIILYLLLGLAGLIGGGELFVKGATGIARSLGVSDAVIGLTLVAGGTSLPELATSIIAARKGQSAMAIGNVVGSNLFNIFGILGCCAVIAPLPIGGIAWTDFAVLFGASVLFWLFSRSGRHITRLEGLLLCCCYVGYLAWLIYNL